jgi:CRP-like cAMP-binding protein
MATTTLLVVRKPDFKELLAQHVELYDALLRLNCRRLRLMFDQFEDLNTRPLQARLAKQMLLLARRATASSRATRSASACSWRRKTWRSCWALRASASTRS